MKYNIINRLLRIRGKSAAWYLFGSTLQHFLCQSLEVLLSAIVAGGGRKLCKPKLETSFQRKVFQVVSPRLGNKAVAEKVNEQLWPRYLSACRLLFSSDKFYIQLPLLLFESVIRRSKRKNTERKVNPNFLPTYIKENIPPWMRLFR